MPYHIAAWIMPFGVLVLFLFLFGLLLLCLLLLLLLLLCCFFLGGGQSLTLTATP